MGSPGGGLVLVEPAAESPEQNSESERKDLHGRRGPIGQQRNLRWGSTFERLHHTRRNLRQDSTFDRLHQTGVATRVVMISHGPRSGWEAGIP